MLRPENRLKDKVAIITGSSCSIGKGIVEVFAREGAKVVIVGRIESDLKQVVDAIIKTVG